MDRITELMRRTDVDLILIYNSGEPVVDLSFFYLTELLDSGLFEGSYVIANKERKRIITSKLEETSAKKSDFEVVTFKNNEDKNMQLKEAMHAKKIGVNMDCLSAADFNRLKNLGQNSEFVDISPLLKNMRMIKSDKEIRILRDAAKIVSIAAEEIVNYMKEGIRENELAARLTYLILNNGGTDNAFTPIVAFGENSAEPHYFPGKRKLKKGEFVLMDFGAKVHKYNSDITRTYFFGRASEEQSELYNTVLKAQKIGIENVRAERNGKEIDLTVRSFIDSTKYKGLFIHSLGHGLGLATHDHVGMAPSSELVMKENMVVTVEPGIYITAKEGVRIEDDVVVKSEGCEVLTTANKDLLEI